MTGGTTGDEEILTIRFAAGTCADSITARRDMGTHLRAGDHAGRTIIIGSVAIPVVGGWRTLQGVPGRNTGSGVAAIAPLYGSGTNL